MTEDSSHGNMTENLAEGKIIGTGTESRSNEEQCPVNVPADSSLTVTSETVRSPSPTDSLCDIEPSDDPKLRWLFSNQGLCSRSYALRPQVRLMREMRANMIKDGIWNSSDTQIFKDGVVPDKLIWNSFGYHLQRVFVQIALLSSFFEFLPLDSTWIVKSTFISKYLKELLSKLPFPSNIRQGKKNLNIPPEPAMCFTSFVNRMKELIQLFRYILSSKHALIFPSYFKAEFSVLEKYVHETVVLAGDGTSIKLNDASLSNDDDESMVSKVNDQQKDNFVSCDVGEDKEDRSMLKLTDESPISRIVKKKIESNISSPSGKEVMKSKGKIIDSLFKSSSAYRDSKNSKEVQTLNLSLIKKGDINLTSLRNVSSTTPTAAEGNHSSTSCTGPISSIVTQSLQPSLVSASNSNSTVSLSLPPSLAQPSLGTISTSATRETQDSSKRPVSNSKWIPLSNMSSIFPSKKSDLKAAKHPSHDSFSKYSEQSLSKMSTGYASTIKGASGNSSLSLSQAKQDSKLPCYVGFGNVSPPLASATAMLNAAGSFIKSRAYSITPTVNAELSSCSIAYSSVSKSCESSHCNSQDMSTPSVSSTPLEFLCSKPAPAENANMGCFGSYEIQKYDTSMGNNGIPSASPLSPTLLATLLATKGVNDKTKTVPQSSTQAKASTLPSPDLPSISGRAGSKKLNKPKPTILEAVKYKNRIVMKWSFVDEQHSHVVKYIVYFCGIKLSNGVPKNWTKFSQVDPCPLPMTLTLTHTEDISSCILSVKAMFSNGLSSEISEAVFV